MPLRSVVCVFGSVAGQEIEHPMAIVILGGLVASTVLNLFIVPTLYLRFGKSRKELARHSGGGPGGKGTEPAPA